jgi:multidrug efflux system membrane fusion protein
VANPDFSLLPGQYVRVRVHLKQQPNTLMVPQVAVGSNQFGKYVYVLGKDNTVDLRLVSLGSTQGELVAVEKGLTDTDKVIDGNLQKIGPGMPVQPLPDKPAAAAGS